MFTQQLLNRNIKTIGGKKKELPGLNLRKQNVENAAVKMDSVQDILKDFLNSVPRP